MTGEPGRETIKIQDEGIPEGFRIVYINGALFQLSSPMKGTGEMKIVRRMITGILCCVLTACTAVFCARGETAAVLPPHIQLAGHPVIEAADLPLYEYSVTLREFLSCDPADIHSGRVTATDHYKSDYAAWDNMDYYTFEDGYLLTRSGTELCLGNRFHENYSQLLAYMDDTEKPVPEKEPFPLRDAQERCRQIIEQLDLGYLVQEQAVPLSPDLIESLTEEIRERYDGHKPACFEAFPEEIGAWCLTFRQELGGIAVTNLNGTPQVRIVLTKDETALLEIDNIIDKIDEAKLLAGRTSPEDALRAYLAEHPDEQKEDRRETFRIDRIAPAYCADSDWDKQTVPVKVRLCPCWQIESRRMLQTDSGDREDALYELYWIPGGEKIRPVIIGE